MIFADKCKEINRQYMLNNNAELDNGVYNENEEKAKEEEQDGLMGMNQQIEGESAAPGEASLPVSNLNSNIGSLNTSQILIDEENVEKMQHRFGYDPNYVITELNNDELNHATTTYFLIDITKEF